MILRLLTTRGKVALVNVATVTTVTAEDPRDGCAVVWFDNYAQPGESPDNLCVQHTVDEIYEAIRCAGGRIADLAGEGQRAVADKG